MSHAARTSVAADSEELGCIFNKMHCDCGATHYAARLIVQLVARLLNHQGIALGKDFAKSSYLDGLELSALSNQ